MCSVVHLTPLADPSNLRRPASSYRRQPFFARKYLIEESKPTLLDLKDVPEKQPGVVVFQVMCKKESQKTVD